LNNFYLRYPICCAYIIDTLLIGVFGFKADCVCLVFAVRSVVSARSNTLRRL